MDYAKLRAYIVHKISENIDARMKIATDYEKNEEFQEFSGKIAAYMDVWMYAEALDADIKEVNE